MLSVRIAILGLTVAVIASCANDEITYPTGSRDTSTVIFKDGLSPYQGYDGTRDAIIKNGPGNDFRNRCYGTEPMDTLGFSFLAGSFYERRLVVEMDLSIISDCAEVLSAVLSISVNGAGIDTITLAAHRILRPTYSSWVEGRNGLQTGVSWLTVDGAESWYSEGGDFDSAALDVCRIAGDTVVSFSLPAWLVRTWISSPESNHGILVRCIDPPSSRFAIAYLRETPLESRRPQLKLVYIRSSYG